MGPEQKYFRTTKWVASGRLRGARIVEGMAGV
ncbi:MAG: hypothetical protein H6Q30_655 [Bacteroidetes bacterium]|nr:hypothetical protein [Bacteroidota bacterium]